MNRRALLCGSALLLLSAGAPLACGAGTSGPAANGAPPAAGGADGAAADGATGAGPLDAAVSAPDAPASSDAGATGDAADAASDDARASCAPAPTSNLVVSVASTGAKGDGVTDDTAAFQAAVNQVGGTGGTVLVPAGTYMIDALKSVSLASKMTFKMDPGATLKTITNGADTYNVLFAQNQSDLTIVGGTLVGDRATHTGTTGEWGVGVNVSASTRVVIEGVTTKDFWGDGFYVADGSDTVTVCSVLADNNRRQGLSITGADNVLVQDSTFQNTNGTEPMSGIDIEPNAGFHASHSSVLRCTFLNNAGAGILMYAGAAPISDITFRGNSVADSGNNGAVTLSGVQTATIADNTLEDAYNWGVGLIDGTTGVTVTGNDITVKGQATGNAILDKGTGNTITGNTIH